MAERTLDVLHRYDVLTREGLLELLESARGRPHLSLHLNVNPAVRTLKEARLQVRAMAERRLAWVPPEQRHGRPTRGRRGGVHEAWSLSDGRTVENAGHSGDDSFIAMRVPRGVLREAKRAHSAAARAPR